MKQPSSRQPRDERSEDQNPNASFHPDNKPELRTRPGRYPAAKHPELGVAPRPRKS